MLKKKSYGFGNLGGFHQVRDCVVIAEVLVIHGLGQTAQKWAPRARCVVCHTVGAVCGLGLVQGPVWFPIANY